MCCPEGACAALIAENTSPLCAMGNKESKEAPRGGDNVSNNKIPVKLVLLGGITGKTCIVNRIADDQFTDTIPTLGVEYKIVVRYHLSPPLGLLVTPNVTLNVPSLNLPGFSPSKDRQNCRRLTLGHSRAGKFPMCKLSLPAWRARRNPGVRHHLAKIVRVLVRPLELFSGARFRRPGEDALGQPGGHGG